jgi:large subunit ribosomal protein L10
MIMEKIGNLIRKISEDQIRINLKQTDSVFVVVYSGLSGPDMNTLRHSLRVSKSNFFVVKNSISKRVFNELGLAEVANMLQGPCGLVFVKDDLIATSKVLYNFAKEHETFKIEGGIVEKRILQKSDISTLANMPSKQVLYTKIVVGIKSPINNLVCVLNNTLNKFVIVLDQIKKKKATT